MAGLGGPAFIHSGSPCKWRFKAAIRGWAPLLWQLSQPLSQPSHCAGPACWQAPDSQPPPQLEQPFPMVWHPVFKAKPAAIMMAKIARFISNYLYAKKWVFSRSGRFTTSHNPINRANHTYQTSGVLVAIAGSTQRSIGQQAP